MPRRLQPSIVRLRLPPALGMAWIPIIIIVAAAFGVKAVSSIHQAAAAQEAAACIVRLRVVGAQQVALDDSSNSLSFRRFLPFLTALCCSLTERGVFRRGWNRHRQKDGAARPARPASN